MSGPYVTSINNRVEGFMEPVYYYDVTIVLDNQSIKLVFINPSVVVVTILKVSMKRNEPLNPYEFDTLMSNAQDKQITVENNAWNSPWNTNPWDRVYMSAPEPAAKYPIYDPEPKTTEAEIESIVDRMDNKNVPNPIIVDYINAIPDPKEFTLSEEAAQDLKAMQGIDLAKETVPVPKIPAKYKIYKDPLIKEIQEQESSVFSGLTSTKGPTNLSIQGPSGQVGPTGIGNFITGSSGYDNYAAPILDKVTREAIIEEMYKQYSQELVKRVANEIAARKPEPPKEVEPKVSTRIIDL